MKYQCDMIKDLLPLYHDKVCSKASQEIIEEHLLECDSCKKEMGKINNDIYDDSLQEERTNVIGRYSKKIKRKSMLVGLAISGLLGIPILICLIVNLATGHGLDWFFIALTSIMVLASVTVVPLVAETKKLLLTVLSFTGSLLILLGTICIYTHGNWFPISAISILFAMSIIFSPYVLYQFPNNDFISKNKGLLSMATSTTLLYLLIIVAGFYAQTPGYWRISMAITTASILLPWVIFAIIRYTKMNGFSKAGICLIYSGIFSTLINDIIYRITEGYWYFRLSDINLLNWSNYIYINANVTLIILLSCSVIGGLLLLFGRLRK